MNDITVINSNVEPYFIDELTINGVPVVYAEEYEINRGNTVRLNGVHVKLSENMVKSKVNPTHAMHRSSRGSKGKPLRW